MSKRKSESPKTCTIGLGDIESRVKAFARLPPAKQLAALRLRRRGLLRRKSLTDSELATIRAIDSLPADPGQGHPCRPLWLVTMQKIYESDSYLMVLTMCLSMYPPGPVPPIV